MTLLLVGWCCQQHMWAWLSYVSVACVISYVVCFAVGLGMNKHEAKLFVLQVL